VSATALVLAAALGWTLEPGIVCRLESPGEVHARMREPAEGEYRLSAYGDPTPSAGILELRREGEVQARIIEQVLEHSCTVHVTQAQCPALADAWDVAQRLAVTAEADPPPQNTWEGYREPSHLYFQSITYGQPGGGTGGASYEVVMHASHPALELIGRLRDIQRTCAPGVRPALIRADKRSRDQVQSVMPSRR